MIKNKVIVNFFLESGCSQEDDEVSTRWHPINFQIYDDQFVDLIREAISEWLDEHIIAHEVPHEVIFAHVIERDGVGAVTSEYFEPVLHEQGFLQSLAF